MMKSQIVSKDNSEWITCSVNDACERIAPVWPLDKSIAVNPWWKMRGEPMPTVAAKLQTLGNVKMLMSKAYYRNMWETQIDTKHLSEAANLLGVNENQEALLQYLQTEDDDSCWQHLGDLLDQQRSHIKKIPWRDEIVQQISQFSALYFQYPERMQYSNDSDNGFYKMWLDVVNQDKGIEILMGEPGLHKQFSNLPKTIDALFSLAQHNLGETIDRVMFTEYCHALLLDINGWASWTANASWQAAFVNENSNLIQQLLAIRLAWDIALWQHSNQKTPEKFLPIKETFIQQLQTIEHTQKKIEDDQRFAWVWQTALELSFQKNVALKLLKNLKTESPPVQNTETELHAFFCIDVRSEPIRRALESQSPTIKTSGFAGFFGLPVEYKIESSHFSRPQLPGLLKASISAAQKNTPLLNKDIIFRKVANKRSADASPSTFGIVEATGLCKIADLMKSSFFPSKPATGVSSLVTNEEWSVTSNGKEINDSELAELVANILFAMTLTTDFAKRILLVGHSSSTTNNPHAAGLDCGACGGQSGEVNVKVLAQLLNSDGVRKELNTHGIDIPDRTRFVACLHNTTTDDLIYFDPDLLFTNETWINDLAAATALAQKKRSESVGIVALDDEEKTKKQFDQKANNWAQLRPEWGLANNAAFIVAPRSLTKAIDLEGRSFLHDYHWQQDKAFSLLELIITAPMVVTNWINLQYYASVTDNKKYGSGNKLLHNVVGGDMGVFEGNGGDLRIGLPLQSIHDGKQWRHQALRLNVYIAAPRQTILDIVTRHKHIGDLVNNSWLHLFQLDNDDGQIWQLKENKWVVVDS